MDLTKLTRQSHRNDRPGVSLLGQFRLAARARMKSAAASRRRLALWLAAETAGPILWIRPAWHPDRLHMAGVRAEIDPGRLIFVEPDRPEDILWAMEEALRAGVVALVVADLPDPPGLTPVRRLHLAAEAGLEARGMAGLGLIVTPGDGGGGGRQPLAARPRTWAGGAGWRLARLRGRDAPPGEWAVRRGRTGGLWWHSGPRNRRNRHHRGYPVR